MTARQALVLSTVLVFVALATVLHTWQAIGDALAVWLTVIGEGVR